MIEMVTEDDDVDTKVSMDTDEGDGSQQGQEDSGMTGRWQHESKGSYREVMENIVILCY